MWQGQGQGKRQGKGKGKGVEQGSYGGSCPLLQKEEELTALPFVGIPR